MNLQRNRIVLADWDNTLCAGYTVVPWTEFLEEIGLYRGARTLKTLLTKVHSGGFPSYDAFCERMAETYAEGIAGTAHHDVVTAATMFVSNDTRLFAFVRHLFS